MIYNGNATEYSVASFLFSFILPSGSQAAADMAFLFIHIQNFPDLQIQGVIVLFQPLGNILMYRGFGNAEVLGGRPDRGTGFDYVHSQLTGPVLRCF